MLCFSRGRRSARRTVCHPAHVINPERILRVQSHQKNLRGTKASNSFRGFDSEALKGESKISSRLDYGFLRFIGIIRL